jgi:sRNA-binding protein
MQPNIVKPTILRRSTIGMFNKPKPPVVNLVKKLTSKISSEDYVEFLKKVVHEFPLCFSIEHPKPLKVGIRVDLAKHYDMSHRKIGLFLMKYCNTPSYNKIHVLNAKRVDLKGNFVGLVTQKHLDNLAITKGNIKRNLKAKTKAEEKLRRGDKIK